MNHSKIEEFRRTVKVNALKVAKEKATDLAEAIGQKVGRAIHITESPSNNHFFYLLFTFFIRCTLFFVSKKATFVF